MPLSRLGADLLNVTRHSIQVLRKHLGLIQNVALCCDRIRAGRKRIQGRRIIIEQRVERIVAARFTENLVKTRVISADGAGVIRAGYFRPQLSLHQLIKLARNPDDLHAGAAR